MILNKIEDPRDNLEKARRPELFAFAQANRVPEIVTEDMPAVVMRTILRNKGLSRISIPRRPLGLPVQAQMEPGQKVQEVDAAADLARQWQAESKPVSEMGITDLRKACKERGIKMERRDNMQTLRAKLNG